MELNTTICISILGGIFLIGIFYKMNNGVGEFNLKLLGITLVVLVVVILALSNIDPTRLAPAYGILGAISGYLFGRKD